MRRGQPFRLPVLPEVYYHTLADYILYVSGLVKCTAIQLILYLEQHWKDRDKEKGETMQKVQMCKFKSAVKMTHTLPSETLHPHLFLLHLHSSAHWNIFLQVQHNNSFSKALVTPKSVRFVFSCKKEFTPRVLATNLIENLYVRFSIWVKAWLLKEHKKN